MVWVMILCLLTAVISATGGQVSRAGYAIGILGLALMA
jgi:hypothetical protein